MATNEPALAGPAPRIKVLERLVGTWRVEGGAQGTVTYRWMEGGFFLIQEVDLLQHGQRIQGLEIIGQHHPFGQEPGHALVSRFYDSMGNTFDYEYEVEGEELVIWAGAKGSPAYFRGRFSADGNRNSGAWTYPGGGGYESVMVRIK
jgi:hypothetical protein